MKIRLKYKLIYKNELCQLRYVTDREWTLHISLKQKFLPRAIVRVTVYTYMSTMPALVPYSL